MPLICLPPPSSPLCYSHASAPPPPPSCTSLYPLWPSLPLRFPSPTHTHMHAHIHTQTKRPTNTFIHCAVVKERAHENKRTCLHSHSCTCSWMWTHLSCDVRCAMGSRWVESQCWLSLHWAPRGVFIVVKINKATVTKRSSPSQIQAQGYVRGHVRTCARTHSRASWQPTKNEEEEKKKKKKTKQKGSLTHAKWQKLTKNILVLTRKDKSTAGPCSE